MELPPITAWVACAVFVSAQLATACTWFRFENDKKKAFIGRTMEWPGDLNAMVTRMPRNHDFGTFKAEQGFVGISHNGIFSDGMNEHGLAVSGLWLSETKYPEKTPDSRPITDLIPLVLGNAKTVDEALAAIKEKPFYGVTTDLQPGLVVTLHYAISDPSGR